METHTVNVNLRPCTCGYHVGHGDHCRGKPVLVPLPLEPWRFVTMKVRLGECRCAAIDNPNRHPDSQLGHIQGCPARLVDVTCSIQGETWAESEVVKVAARGWDAVGAPPMLAACRARWALFRALVTGRTFEPNEWDDPDAVRTLLAQRDTQFAALADLRNAEDAMQEAMERIERGLRPDVYWNGTRRPSEEGLSRYVEHLIEQVGLL